MKAMKFLQGLFLSIFCTTLTFAQNTEKFGIDPKVIKGKLPNGLTYIVRENAKPEKKVELRLVVKVGSVNEDDDQQGLAHMAEHMAFNGTKNFKKNEIVSFLQDIGVGFGNDLNAYTSFDETVYILPIPTDKPGNLEKGFQVLEDWAHNVTYLDEDINNERAIILEESRTRKGSEDRMFRKVFPELFKGSKYANRIPIGVDSIIANFPTDAIRRFYRDWYRPDLMAVIVVGDIKQDQAVALIKKHFAGLTNPAKPRQRKYEDVPPYTAAKSMVIQDDEATSYDFGWNFSQRKKIPSNTIDAYREELIKGLYTSMLNSRLRELTQKENPPFVFASAGFGAYAKFHEGFQLSASSGTNDIRKSVNAVTEEIERIKRYGFTEAELERAKKDQLSAYERSWNNRDKRESSTFADEYIRHFTDDEVIPGIDKEFEVVKQSLPNIKLADVNAITDRFKNEKNYFSYIMGPMNTSSVTAPSDTELMAALSAKEKADIKPYEEKVIAASLLSKEPIAGKIISKTTNDKLGTTEIKLSNGVTISLKKTDFKADQILLSSYRYGGNAGYSEADKYSAENAVAVVSSMGVGNFNPVDLRKALAGKVASANPYISATGEGFKGSSSNKDIETMLQLLYLYATETRIDSSLFKSYIQKTKSQFAMMGANPQFAFIDTLYKTLYNGNPLAPTALPKAENYDKVDLKKAVTIYKERLSDFAGMHFDIVGSFSETDILPLLEKYIGGLPTSSKMYSYTDNKVRPFKGDKELIFKKGKEKQSLILVLAGGEIAYSPEVSFNMQALSEVLNIKIIEELREKIQGIYGGGTNGGVNRIPYGSFQFALQLPCGPDKVDTLIKAYKAELASIASKGVEPSYLDKVKKQWIEEHKTSMKTNEYWLGKLQQFRQGDNAPERMFNFESYVNAISSNDIQSAAKLVQSATTKLTAVLLPE